MYISNLINLENKSYDFLKKQLKKFDVIFENDDENVKSDLDTVNSNNVALQTLLNEVNTRYKKVDKNIDLSTFLTGTTLVKPYFNSNLNKFKFLVFPSHLCDFTSYAEDATEAKEIKVDYLNNNVKINEIWDNKNVELYVDGSSKSKNINEYGFIPFVKFVNNEKSFDFFDVPKTGLLKTQNQLSIKLINTDKTFKYQSRSMLVLKSDTNTISDLKIGPSARNAIQKEDELQFIKPDANLISLIDFIKEEFSILSKMYNIPDSIFSLNSNASAVSILASKSEIDEYLTSREQTFINFEKELFVKSIKILAKHKNITIPENFDINITYKKRKKALTQEAIKLINGNTFLTFLLKFSAGSSFKASALTK